MNTLSDNLPNQHAIESDISSQAEDSSLHSDDLENYSTLMQALISCQERINSYRTLTGELTSMLEKLEALNSHYLSYILAHGRSEMKQEEQEMQAVR